jgi:site-specific recombinase XerD
MRLRRVLPAIGHLKIHELTAGRLERFLQDLGRGDGSHPQLKGASINRYHSLLSSFFGYAVRQGLVEVNPMGKVPRAKESPIHVRYLGREEQRSLVRAIREVDPKKVVEIELAILTGLRRSEQFGAEWQNWKSKEGILYVKGKTGARAVQINRAAGRCLKRLRKRAPEAQFVTPERNETATDRRLWFSKAVKKAELHPMFYYRDLRHTFASRLAIDGVPLLEIQQLLGHKSINMTLRYAHLSPERRRAGIERVRF